MELKDPFHGIQDIKQGLIRCVGTPDHRFQEDALRMFRAVRFSAQLGFSIERSTAESISQNAHLAAYLAVERICTELEKTLCSPSPSKIALFFSTGLMDRFLIHSFPQDAQLHFPGKMGKTAQFAQLYLELQRLNVVQSASIFFNAFRLDHKTVANAEKTIQILMEPLPSSSLEMRRLLCRYGLEPVTCATEITPQIQPLLMRVLEAGECYSLRDLAITGADLKALGYAGPEIGKQLKALLSQVIEQPELNTKPQLQKILSKEL
jgi:tRNA nucleotidyltransferase (CCA-adding enzyme)